MEIASLQPHTCTKSAQPSKWVFSTAADLLIYSHDYLNHNAEDLIIEKSGRITARGKLKSEIRSVTKLQAADEQASRYVA